MFPQNTIENLELKLAQSRKEKEEISKKVEKDFKKEYSPFLKDIFGKDFLGASRYLSAFFQIEKIDNPEKNNSDIFKNALEKTLDIFPVSFEKKEVLRQKILGLSEKTSFLKEKIINHSDLKKDINYPIIESLLENGVLTKEDLVNLSLSYKKTKNIADSLAVLDEYKIEIIQSNLFELNNISQERKIDNFKNDFSEEIENSKLITIYPRLLKFVGRNYSKLKLKNKVETKKERLRRMFKIAFLKLYRLKYSGIDITAVLQKIETLENLDEFISLLIKFFEELKQNPSLSQDYVVLDDIDEVSEIFREAEENKKKEIEAEQNILKTTKIVEEIEEGLGESYLENLLSEDTDLVGDEFYVRTENPPPNLPLTRGGSTDKSLSLAGGDLEGVAGILAEKKENLDEEEEEEEQKKLSKDDLEEEFEKLREELFILEEKKRKLFLEGRYDEIDELNDELIVLGKKAEKLKKLLGIGVEEFYEED